MKSGVRGDKMKIWKVFLLATLFVVISGLWLWRWHLTMEEAIKVPDAVHLVGEEVAFGKISFGTIQKIRRVIFFLSRKQPLEREMIF